MINITFTLTNSSAVIVVITSQYQTLLDAKNALLWYLGVYKDYYLHSVACDSVEFIFELFEAIGETDRLTESCRRHLESCLK